MRERDRERGGGEREGEECRERISYTEISNINDDKGSKTMFSISLLRFTPTPLNTEASLTVCLLDRTPPTT